MSATVPVTSEELAPSALLVVENHPFTKTYAQLSRTIKDAGLMRRRYDFYAALGGGLGVAVLGLVAGFLLLGDSWFQLLIAGGLGAVLGQFGFLGHEASHRAIFRSGRRNDQVGRVLSTFVTGLSYSWWMNKHNRHHANPNTLGKDPDIDTDTIVFHEPAASRVPAGLRWITQRQGTLFFPLLTLEGINLHAKSFAWLFDPRNKVKGRGFEISMLAARWTLYLGAIFWMLPLGMAFAFLGVQLAVFGVYLGASFAPNHKGMPIIPEDAKVDFLSRQVLTSRNVSGFGMGALLGGLNFQVEHHLFPSMPRPFLGRARVIIREHCESLGIPYTETTLLKSYAIVIAYLNRVGLAARDPFQCPQRVAMGR